MEILAVGTVEELYRPCVDCRRPTGNFCDFCFAATRIPDLSWVENQATPFCTVCEKKFGRCGFCRAELAASATRATGASNLPQRGSAHAQAAQTGNTAATSPTGGGRPRHTGGPPACPGVQGLGKSGADPRLTVQLTNALNLDIATDGRRGRKQERPVGDTQDACSAAPAPLRLTEELLAERDRANRSA